MFVSNLVTGGTLARLPSRSSSTIAPLITLWLVGWLVSPFWVALVDERVPWPWTKPSAIVWGALLVPFLYVLRCYSVHSSLSVEK